MSQLLPFPSYQKYKTPPDFYLAELHAKSCKFYQNLTDNIQTNPLNRCGCCNQYIGTEKASMCKYVSSLLGISQQIPLFFNFITLMMLLIIASLFIKAGEWLFFCEQNSCKIVYCSINGILGFDIKIPMGFMYVQSEEYNINQYMRLMIEIIVYSILILGIKIHLKMKKYKYKASNVGIEKRSVQLINLPKDCTQQEIRNLFKGFNIEEIVFTFRVREYHECMKEIASLKKTLRRYQSQILHSKIQLQQDQKIKKSSQRLAKISKRLEYIVQNIADKQQRLSVAFVVFETTQERSEALEKFYCSFAKKIFFKLCTCYSNSAIRRQHITIQSAPAPDDIKWQNLENPYLRTKAIRFSSFVVCSTILIFGLVSEVIVFNKNNYERNVGQIISSLIIFIINFTIINFLEETTSKIQSRQSNTNIKLSLIRKITFFMFFNVSISPFLTMVYNRQVDGNNPSGLLDTISLTILIVGIGNCFKPLLTVASVPRFLHWYKCYREKSKGYKCQLNQLQANELFQPLEFSIQVYYSLLHASLMMSFFYLGYFQILIVIELPSLLILYFSAKWMLLRVCKQPRGLSLKLNNLAQSLMRFYVPLYWFGRNSIYILTNQNSVYFLDILKAFVYENSYQIASTCIVIFMLVCEVFVAKIAMLLALRKKDEISQYFKQRDLNRTYQQANLFYKIHEEELIKINKRARETIRKYRNSRKQKQSEILI